MSQTLLLLLMCVTALEDIFRYIIGDIYRYIIKDIYIYMVGYLKLQGARKTAIADQHLFLERHFNTYTKKMGTNLTFGLIFYRQVKLIELFYQDSTILLGFQKTFILGLVLAIFLCPNMAITNGQDKTQDKCLQKSQ